MMQGPGRPRLARQGATLSSFVVGTDLIDLLATAAWRIRNGKMPDRFFD